MESIFERSLKAPSIACLGGGTGLSTMLRGLKRYTSDITAIVTVTDDGGGSGVLRDELGMPPPGDIRNCILALSNIEPTMEKLIAYRFESGSLEGQSFGNLLLAAMNGISSSFDRAVARMGEVLAITGRVLPVTNEDIRLFAELEDGSVVFGESKIFEAKRARNCRIRRVQIVPSPVSALPESIRAIEEADLIILGPGSLYTSVIPNLLVGGIAKAIEKSRAQKLYIANIMTQPGETEGYTVSDHIKELFRHASGGLFDMCLVNSAPADPLLLARYETEGALPITADLEEIERLGVAVYTAPLVARRGALARHDPDLLAHEIMKIYRAKAPTRLYDGRKVL
ncbi:YvcK family protein [Oscillospiraceae bacterium WX1]